MRVTDLDWHPGHDAVVTICLPGEDGKVRVPPERHHLVLLHAHAEGVEDPYRGVPHQLGGDMTERTVEKGVPEGVVDQIWPQAEQRITVEYWRSVVASHITVQRPVNRDVVTGLGQGLHDVGRHDVPEHQNPLLSELLLLLLGEDDGVGWGVRGGWVGRADLVVGEREGETPEERSEQDREGQQEEKGQQGNTARSRHFSHWRSALTGTFRYLVMRNTN